MRCSRVGGRLYFRCPGCRTNHCIAITTWTWNGSMELPTFWPSVLWQDNVPEERCHFYVEDGRIRFLEDCHHELRGQTVDIPECY